MSEHEAFFADFLEHKYDPIKAREYYLRTRKLKGRATAVDRAKAKEYVTRTTADAQTKLNADLKKTKVKKNPARRIGEAEQKLIRAKSLAARIEDPVLRAEMLEKISATEKKLKAVKAKQPRTAKRTSPARRAPAKKAPAQKAPAKKAPAQSSSARRPLNRGMTETLKVKPSVKPVLRRSAPGGV